MSWNRIQERNERLGETPFQKNSSGLFERLIASCGLWGKMHMGTVFKKGDRVKIRMTAGVKSARVDGEEVSFFSGPNQTGTVIGFPRDNIVAIRYDAQDWSEISDQENPIRQPEFESTINIDYLVKT